MGTNLAEFMPINVNEGSNFGFDLLERIRQIKIHNEDESFSNENQSKPINSALLALFFSDSFIQTSF